MAAVMIGAGVVLLCGLYLFAVAPNSKRKNQMMHYSQAMFAHRGYHNADKLIPENSMASFRAAVANGYGIELDVHITKDGKVAVFHDDTLERMCGVKKRIEDCTWAELQKQHLLNTTEKIPELPQVLNYVDGQVPLLVELKIPGKDLRVCNATHEILKSYKGEVLVQSFNTLGLRWYRRNAPEVLRGQLSSNLTKEAITDPYVLRFLVKHLLLNAFGRPDFISYKLKDLPNVGVLLCRYLWKVPVAVWTLRTEAALREGQAGYDICIFEKRGERYKNTY